MSSCATTHIQFAEWSNVFGRVTIPIGRGGRVTIGGGTTIGAYGIPYPNNWPYAAPVGGIFGSRFGNQGVRTVTLGNNHCEPRRAVFMTGFARVGYQNRQVGWIMITDPGLPPEVYFVRDVSQANYALGQLVPPEYWGVVPTNTGRTTRIVFQNPFIPCDWR